MEGQELIRLHWVVAGVVLFLVGMLYWGIGELLGHPRPDYYSTPPVEFVYEEWSHADTRELIRLTGLPPVMERIAGCESNHRPEAWNRTKNRNGTEDWGLWQINDIWEDELRTQSIIRRMEDLFNPYVNAKAAAVVIEQQGLTAWSCYR